jgi:hypothetical protein
MIGGSSPGRDWEFFSSPSLSGPALGHTQPLIHWVPGALSLGVKRPGREVGYSPLSSAEVKNTWSYTSTPQYVFMAWCLVKEQGQLLGAGATLTMKRLILFFF